MAGWLLGMKVRCSHNDFYGELISIGAMAIIRNEAGELCRTRVKYLRKRRRPVKPKPRTRMRLTNKERRLALANGLSPEQVMDAVS